MKPEITEKTFTMKLTLQDWKLVISILAFIVAFYVQSSNNNYRLGELEQNFKDKLEKIETQNNSLIRLESQMQYLKANQDDLKLNQTEMLIELKEIRKIVK